MKNNVFILGTLLLISAAALADDTAQKQQTNQAPAETNVSTTQQQDNSRMNTGELGMTLSQVGTLLAEGGVVGAGIILVVGLAALAVQIISPRLCSTFGICGGESPHNYHAYSASSPNSVYSDYPAGYSAQTGTYNAPVYQKRSLEYVGPILKALSNAYDKYARQVSATAKKE